MANSLFPKGREGILDETINMSSGDIRVMLVKSTYTYDDTDVYVSDMGAVDNGRSAALASKTFTSGVFDAADPAAFAATAAAATNAYILFKHTGSDATARLISYHDTLDSGLPFTPAAGQFVSLTFSAGANKIFKL
jgi:hypothetical protein